MVAPTTTARDLSQRLSRRIAEAVGQERIKALHRKSVRHAVFTCLHVWAAIALTFLLGSAALPLPVFARAFALAVLAAFMATRINALNVLVHDGSHRSLARSRIANTVLTNLCAGYFIGYDEDAYRRLHLRHHRHLGEAEDPDRPLYELPRTRRSLALAVLSDLLLVSFARRLLVYVSGSRRPGARPPGRSALHLLGKVTANATLLALLAAAFGARDALVLYGVLWILPLLSLYPIIIRLRVVTEHYSPRLFSGAGPAFVARTSACGRLEHYLLGAGMDYHLEHHLFPGIPYDNLKRLHAALVESGFFEAEQPAPRSDLLSPGYVAYWSALLRSEAGLEAQAASS